MKFIAIIPARYQSSRFPGKPLAMIGDRPMIQRVYQQVSKCLTDVYVATDDERIANAVNSFGGKVVMTRTDHQSGTDRIREAADKILAGKPDSNDYVIINVQGDEPFINPEQIMSVMSCFDSENVALATLARPFDKTRGYDALADPNMVKIMFSDQMEALYFSRSVIPYVRGAEKCEWPDKTEYFSHIGIYAYRYETLKEITELKRSKHEIAESLEQLRWLDNGYKIKVAISNYPTIGIDTPADLEEAIKFVKTFDTNE
ncbi:MAG: 3-deoxy-manno-octulosonate cytidylyltransferase [Muribaculaceae bacterium]|nr:3-deoxy-manno-octulosonate cytidylyltransferase [Muribaculaceae bacterium]